MSPRDGRKSGEIRQLLIANPRMRNSEIMAALSARKIAVSSAHVSNVRKRLATGKPLGKPGRPRKAQDRVSLATLLEAKRLADQLGGVERALEVFRALATLG